MTQDHRRAYRSGAEGDIFLFFFLFLFFFAAHGGPGALAPLHRLHGSAVLPGSSPAGTALTIVFRTVRRRIRRRGCHFESGFFFIDPSLLPVVLFGRLCSTRNTISGDKRM